MGKRRVAVTGLGLVSPYGAGETAPAFFAHLLRAESAVQAWRPDPSFLDIDLPVVRRADFEPRTFLGAAAAHTLDRATQLACVAAEAAWHDARLPRALDDDARGAVCWGTSRGGIHAIEAAYDDVMTRGRRRVSPLLIVKGMHNAAAAHIAQWLGLGGPATTQAVACASSTLAIADGLRLVRDGVVDVALVGGAEARLTAGTLLSWHAMQVLAPAGDGERAAARACRPFDAQRTGLVLGEGAAALVLEDWDHAQRRGATIFAELAGAGASCDHHHLTQPQARGQLRALRAALFDADMDAAAVDHVNAHGTGTAEGDPVEIDVLRQLFGARAHEVAVSATKSMHGHSLGATGAVEALVTVLALHRQTVPPTAQLDEVDARCAGVQHVRAAQARPLRAALSSSFAFGGSNAVLAFRRA
jgi:3-oxoacyl-[acyl-carrier-protein] synthase II